MGDLTEIESSIMLAGESSFDAGPVRINYMCGSESGPVLVLLHGLMDRWQTLLPVIEPLAERWRVLAPDMRGHGRSGWAPDGVYRLEELAADLAAFMHGVVGEPAVLFAHSAAAFATATFAVRFPDLCRGVAIGDMSFDVDHLDRQTSSAESVAYYRMMRELAGSSVDVIADRLAGLHPDLDPSWCRDMAESLHCVDPHTLDYHAEGRLKDLLGGFDGDGTLRQISAPTLIIQADPRSGAVVSDAYAAHALGILGDGQHARLDSISHNLGLDTGEVAPLLSSLTEFLDSL
ncbi:MAG: alpha/beta hydrolase [Acidimicrobiia bacterium]|nr:alpha/beta hydrolase [Acidimicrobiia bacterium]